MWWKGGNSFCFTFNIFIVFFWDWILDFLYRNVDFISSIYPEWNSTTLTEEIYLNQFQANQSLMQTLNLTKCSLEDDLDNVTLKFYIQQTLNLTKCSLKDELDHVTLKFYIQYTMLPYMFKRKVLGVLKDM